MEKIPPNNPSPEKNEEVLLEEFLTLANTACELIKDRIPSTSEELPGEDILEEARYAYYFLGDDPESATYSAEMEVKTRMEEIKDAIPTLPLR
jgi:hypothetical protein